MVRQSEHETEMREAMNHLREREKEIKTKSLVFNVFPVPFPKSLVHTLVPVFRSLCDFTSCPYSNLSVECFSRLQFHTSKIFLPKTPAIISALNYSSKVQR